MEYSGNLHSAVDKLGRYLQGKYIYSGPGSVVDVLTQYYILAYQGGGKTEEEARSSCAEHAGHDRLPLLRLCHGRVL